MSNKIFNWLNIKYPQNYIIRVPFIGALIIAVFAFGFTALYKPLDFHASRGLSYETTMAIYSLVAGISVIFNVKILKNIKWFAEINDWTIFKELTSALFVLLGMGIVIYLTGFIVEASEQHWRIPAFLNSIKNVISVEMIPFAFFTAINYRYLFSESINPNEGNIATTVLENQPPEDLIQIGSQLKKEELSFYPSQFLYAESDGNYVVFYLNINNLVKKEIIRNSINNIEQQLSGIPYFLRIHRAFIVNLKKVRSKQGNTLGYLIKLTETEFKIPVSRKNARVFNNLLALYHA